MIPSTIYFVVIGVRQMRGPNTCAAEQFWARIVCRKTEFLCADSVQGTFDVRTSFLCLSGEQPIH